MQTSDHGWRYDGGRLPRWCYNGRRKILPYQQDFLSTRCAVTATFSSYCMEYRIIALYRPSAAYNLYKHAIWKWFVSVVQYGIKIMCSWYMQASLASSDHCKFIQDSQNFMTPKFWSSAWWKAFPDSLEIIPSLSDHKDKMLWRRQLISVISTEIQAGETFCKHLIC